MSRRYVSHERFQPSVYTTGLQPLQSYPAGEMGEDYGFLWPWEVVGLVRKYWWVPPLIGVAALGGVAFIGYKITKKVMKPTDINWDEVEV